ncbi:hypothetical protein AVEN_158126-1 [Araneus ventricosus]|uniref:Uncharacterized protein n=1 Tax=Araneus ventricosus TaxID=182803 RepID=A0A4Y2HRH5_ARAVE|nr:hypothetical protein AVEN_158126-1 [Araneus ventricosus]
MIDLKGYINNINFEFVVEINKEKTLQTTFFNIFLEEGKDAADYFRNSQYKKILKMKGLSGANKDTEISLDGSETLNIVRMEAYKSTQIANRNAILYEKSKNVIKTLVHWEYA